MAPFYLGFVLFSIACGVLLGHAGQLTAALIRGAGRGVELVITLAGPVSLWCGLSKLLEATGWSEKWQIGSRRSLGACFRRDGATVKQGWQSAEIFPQFAWTWKCGHAAGCAGSCAPFRGRGARKRRTLPPGGTQYSVGAAYSGHRGGTSSGLGCATPLDILPAVWVSSVVSVVAGRTRRRCFRDGCADRRAGAGAAWPHCAAPPWRESGMPMPCCWTVLRRGCLC